MFKIDTTGAVASMPTPAALGSPSGWFAHGVDGVTPYTVLSSDWCNAVQAELLAVLTAAGISPDKTNQAQLLAAMQKLGRIKATGNLSLYVAPAGSGGSDSNTGLTSGSPFLTIQKAVNTLYSTYDLGGFTATINLAAGSYTTGAVIVGQPFGASPTSGSPLSFVGAGSGTTTISVTSGNCFMASNGVGAVISGLKLTATGSAGSLTGIGLSASLASTLALGTDVNFGACALGMYASTSANIGLNHAYTISGGGAIHIQATSAGSVTSGGQTVTLTGTPAFSSQFVEADTGGSVNLPLMVFSGSATGVRYAVSTNAVLSSGGGGATYFPGNSAGSSATGGQYI